MRGGIIENCDKFTAFRKTLHKQMHLKYNKSVQQTYVFGFRPLRSFR